MGILKEFNLLLGDFDNIIGLIGVLTGIIGLFVGGIGIKLIKTNNSLKLNKSEVKNSQVANTINNKMGLSVEDTEYVATKIVEEKTKNKPDVYMGKEPPKDAPDGSFWLKPIE